MPRQEAKNDGNLLQLSIFNQSRTLDRRDRTVSLKSFYAADGNDSDTSLNSIMSRGHSIAGDYPVDSQGKYHVPNAPETGKRFRKKVKKMVEKEKDDVNESGNSETAVEMARGTATTKGKKNLSRLVEAAIDDRCNRSMLCDLKSAHDKLKGGRMKLFAARTAIEVEPKLLEKLKMLPPKKSKLKQQLQNDDSPGVYSLHASQLIEQNRIAVASGSASINQVSDVEMKSLVSKCRTDSALTQHLLYTHKYDEKWKSRYADYFITDKSEKKLENKQGWVFPLKRVCTQSGLPSRFFTDNRSIGLADARAQVLYMRLTTAHSTSDWLLSEGADSVSNTSLLNYMNNLFDPKALQRRLNMYVDHVRADQDKVLTGKYYNNIKLGKRMFGPSKKQMFESSMIGGMERRFEILDNQVNHIPFTHDVSDQFPDKRRNQNVHCRDSTRVVLSYPAGCNDDFIHANRVSGGPLFNEFIITQAPMENTIGDFWRIVWQEKVPYVFMLMSRKDEKRCASYWPRRMGSTPMNYHGLKIENAGVDLTRDPLFQVTNILITGPDGEEHRLEHWQGDMNNSSNIVAPLNLLRIARNCSRPVVVHDHLGISRAACLVATEIAISCLIKGPSYKHLIQQSVQFLRSQRAFAIETPMQFVFIHRCVQYMFRNTGGIVRGMDKDYQKWLNERAKRMFVDDVNAPIPGYRLLSPKIDPDLLRQVRRPARPNYRREAPDVVGEWPLPLDEGRLINF